MDLRTSLEKNKGNLSEFGKKIGTRIALREDIELLSQAVEFCTISLSDKKTRDIRTGAAKIVEMVAFARPDLVAPFLDDLLPALEAPEPQTRWMIIRVFGLCAAIRPETAAKAIPYAKRYIQEKREGQLCLVSSADLFLGDYGSTCAERAREAFPLLLSSSDNAIQNEHDWIIESFQKVFPFLSPKERARALNFACEYEMHPRKKTRERVKALLAMDNAREAGPKP
jgi:hypothetical protein